MKGAIVRIAVMVLCALPLVYLAYGALLWNLQESAIFPAPGGIDRSSLDAAAREVGALPIILETSDDVTLYGWHRRADGTRAVLYLHGNGETVADSMALQRIAQQEGWDFVTVAFRGYPGSEGSPSEEGLVRDARAAWDYIVDDLAIPPEKVVVHGRSLGGGIAAALLTEVEPAALVVESSFTSVRELAEAQVPLLPVGLLLRHPIDTRKRAPHIDVPVLVLHGDADTIIPVAHGRRLAELYPNATYLELPGRGHMQLLVVVSREAREAWLALLRRVEAAE